MFNPFPLLLAEKAPLSYDFGGYVEREIFLLISPLFLARKKPFVILLFFKKGFSPLLRQRTAGNFSLPSSFFLRDSSLSLPPRQEEGLF